MTTSTTLAQRLTNREARIAIIGLGYVGMPMGVLFAQAGFRVTGLDVSTERVAQFNRGSSRPIRQICGRLRFLPVVPNRIAAKARAEQGKQDDPFFHCESPGV